MDESYIPYFCLQIFGHPLLYYPTGRSQTTTYPTKMDGFADVVILPYEGFAA